MRVSWVRKRTLSTRNVNRDKMNMHVGMTRCVDGINGSIVNS